MSAEPSASAEPSVVEGADLDLRPYLLGEDFDRAAAALAERPLFHTDAAIFPYRTLHAATLRLARHLLDLGVTPGDRIATLMPNHPLFLVAMQAAWRCGAALAGLNPLYGLPLLQRQLAEVEPKVLLTLDQPDLIARAEAVAPAGTILRIGAVDGSDLSAPANAGDERALSRHLAGLSGAGPDAVSGRTVRDLALLQFTGGTTGVPKAAELTHANISCNLQQIHAMLPGFAYGEENFLALPPFSHIIGSSIILCLGLRLGATMHPLERFLPEEATHLILERRISFMSGVPPMFMAIARAEAGRGGDWSALKYCMTGGAPIPVALIAEFEAVTGTPLMTAYGLSETSPGAVLAPPGERAPEGGTGWPLPGTRVEIRDVGDRGRILPRGERGEICIAGPQVTRGYFRRQEETDLALGDGHLRTGDIGVIDAQGCVWVVDRLKDIIIASGYNIYPALVEEAIYRHPDVAEAAVIGVPDDYRGETVKAVIVPRAGAALDLPALQDFLRDLLSPMEMPKLLELRDALPRSPAGKILRRALREE